MAGLVVALRLLHGDIDQARKDQPILLRGITVVQKLGFSDVIMPGEMGGAWLEGHGNKEWEELCVKGSGNVRMGGAWLEGSGKMRERENLVKRVMGCIIVRRGLA